MSIIDIESLLAVISEAQPAGEDLEYDADFLALTEAASGTPERRMGGSVVAAQEPDWRRVLELGNRLLQRSKDLRIAVLMTRALLQLNGLPGLHVGFGLIQGLITRFWDGLYPELDAGDNNDPTARMNVLTQLTDRDTLLAQLRVAPLIRSRVFGPISWRDIDVAEGRTQALAGAQSLDAAAIEGAFQECDLAELAAATATAEDARDTLRALIQDLNQRVEPTQTPDLTPLTELLSQIHGTLQTHLTTRQPAGVAAPADTSTDSPAATSAAGPAAAAPGQIGNREDVVRTLDRICDYYSRYEPSSPVPLLLKRARRLATGSFVDIMRDLAPDALPQIENVCGISDKP